ncbi:MAG: hypothetical protein KY410_06770, partial [Proteobacteria bacterium]|nr:hypothetical protein [Pseudomonadota bacterium]
MQQLIDHLLSLDWAALATTWGSRILLAIGIFAIGRLLAKLLAALVARVARRARVDATLVRFLTSLTVVSLTVVAAIFAVDQLGVVDGSLRVEDVEVLGEEQRQGRPVVAALPGRDGREVVRLEPDLAGPRQQCPHLLGQPAGRQAGAQ